MYRDDNTAQDDLRRAQELRKQAQLLEDRERVRGSLRELLSISRDAAYSRYVEQMLRDLDSGRAAPWQVEREAARSYERYKQRMQQMQQSKTGEEQQKVQRTVQHIPPRDTAQNEGMKRTAASKDRVELHIGIHVFSLIGALFVLIAFVIFSFHFMNGLAQGLCLYAAAFLLTLLSEIVLRRKGSGFANVVTGIGIGALYIANIVNYLVLGTVNGIVALLLTLLFAVSTILLSYRQKSAVIRIISLLGCYICFVPVKGFETELRFLVITGMLFLINCLCVFLQNQKNYVIMNTVHLSMNMVLTVILTGIAWAEGLEVIYLVGFVAASFGFVNFMAYRLCRKERTALFAVTCIGNGLNLFLLFLLGAVGPWIRDDFPTIFVHLLAGVLVSVIGILTFVFWEKEDARRWIQVYYIVILLLFPGSVAVCEAERVLAVVAALCIVKILSKKEELLILECMVLAWAGFIAVCFTAEDERYCWVIAGALALSAFRIGRLYVFEELATVLSILMAFLGRNRFFPEVLGLRGEWLCPLGVLTVLMFFLLFHHLPQLKGKNQKGYDVTAFVLIALYGISALLCRSWMISAAMLLLGTAAVMLMLRGKYGLHCRGKYVILAGYLTIYALLGNFPSPVLGSVIVMLAALFVVGAGLKQQDKAERIFGLTLAGGVCLKLVLYDFREVQTIYRMLVFLVVGLLALTISFLYIQLEKKMEKSKAALPIGIKEQEAAALLETGDGEAGNKESGN